ncbi:MAG: hypothetical protein IJH79_17970 [Lentisphaeria bacterium]|nr:hypothetical protein [Lentisphaeria bacterium]
MRKMFLAALIGGTALVLAACGEENGESKVQNAAKETAKAADKTADYATGKTQLEQKKKMENKLNQIQQNQNKQLNDALKN